MTTSLTQDEAARRAVLLDVERYDVAVDLSGLLDGPEVRCFSTVTFDCHEPGATTFVDCAAEVTSATLNGAELGPAADGRLELPGLAPHNVLRVESVQADTTAGPGVHKAVDPSDGEVYLWMSFEPDEAHHVWACFDQPDLKAPHAFTVTAPQAWTVLSNSGDPVVEPLGEVRRWTFPATPPLATYNTVVNAGPFHEVRRTAGGYDLGLYARWSLAAVLERDADELFTVTEQGLAFFGYAFGIAFPQHTYNQVFVPEMGGAMENYGCVTWSDAALQRVPPTPAELETLARILLHEMAHMWFGNIVTMRWWDDLWLNEAFAEFAARWAGVSATAYTDLWLGQLIGQKLGAYLVDQGPVSHAIRRPIRDVAEAASGFDAITYDKGASVLAQLKTYVGEEAFRAGMSAYFAEHAWGSTTLADLIDALAEASGRDLERWRRAWLETAGTDRLRLERDGGTHVVQADEGGDPRPQVLAVGAYRRGASGLERTALVQVEVQGPRTPVELPLDADLYLVNDEDLGFVRVGLDPDARAALLAGAAELPSPISRGVAVATVWDQLTRGEATAAEVVHCLVGVLAAETSGSVVELYLDLAADAARLWSPSHERAELTAAVAAAARSLAHGGTRQGALRAAALTAATTEEVRGVEDQAGSDVDLRWRALVRRAQLGDKTATEVADLLERDPDPDAWVRALAVRAGTPNAAEKEAAWTTMTVDRSVPIGSFAEVATAFACPEHEELLVPYAERYLALVGEIGDIGMIPAMVLTYRLFPLFGIHESYLPRAEQAAESASPVVRSALVERADLVRRMLRSRGAADRS